MGKVGPTQLIIVLIIALLIFGPSKLPELGKALGKTVRDFKSAVSEEQVESSKADAEED